MKVSKPLRLYKFIVEVLDEPNCSDEQLECEVQEMLEAYFEAMEVHVTLADATIVDSEIAEA